MKNPTEKEITMNLIKKFLASEDGPTAVEYAVMLALIVVVCIGTITNVGTKVNSSFNSSTTSLP
jgi:pilus assembly protein Flp/PilA